MERIPWLRYVAANIVSRKRFRPSLKSDIHSQNLIIDSSVGEACSVSAALHHNLALSSPSDIDKGCSKRRESVMTCTNSAITCGAMTKISPAVKRFVNSFRAAYWPGCSRMEASTKNVVSTPILIKHLLQNIVFVGQRTQNITHGNRLHIPKAARGTQMTSPVLLHCLSDEFGGGYINCYGLHMASLLPLHIYSTVC